MDLLPFDHLPAHRPRRFVPASIDLGDWKQIAPLFDKLDAGAANCKTASDLEAWLLDWSELSAALDEESSQRHIAMTCHTDNAEAEKAYLHFVENVEPQLKPRQFRLAQAYVAHPLRTKLPVLELRQFRLAQAYVAHPLRTRLPEERYRVFDRDTRLHVELFRPENVPLETAEAKLSQQYQKLSGALTVRFRGEEKTLVQMGRFLEEPERAVRQEAWELVAQRRLQEAEKLDEIFDELVKLREQIARNAGFENYRDYAFRRLGRFEQVEQMVSRTQEIFTQLDGELAAGFQLMQNLRLLDLANRKGKAPGGYQSTLAEARLPFIFMNAVGLQRDVETILHEAGHAFHALASREEDLYAYRSAPIEFCEVASMSMELLGNEFLEAFYAAPEANRARHTHLEGILNIFPWIATVDAFQHWIYTHPGHRRAERSTAWLELMDRFGGDVDWRGYEAARAHLWHRQLHIFIHAFYYVEYGIAQLGALQVWANSRRDKARALHDYKAALALGGSRPLPELFAKAGCRFEFSRQTMAPLVGLVRDRSEERRV